MTHPSVSHSTACTEWPKTEREGGREGWMDGWMDVMLDYW